MTVAFLYNDILSVITIKGWIFLAGSVAGFLSPYISIVVRSMLSKCVTKAELGKIFSLPASIEAGGIGRALNRYN